MITNDREYRITKARIANPEAAIARERTRVDVSPAMRDVYVAALAGNLQTMASEVVEYEDLKAGRAPVKGSSLSALPLVLIKARIAQGWTQKQLADKLQVAEQTVQRYEANNYQGVAIGRLSLIAEILSVQVTGTYVMA
jgi:DNA-binding XRE family transcriptional regulator